jgi:hypothetical protein
MEGKEMRIVNDPLDFIIWFLFTKKKKLGLTKLMKSFQLFTLFNRFQDIGSFNAEQFGARDSYLDALVYKYDNVLLTVDEKKIPKDKEEVDFYEIDLLKDYQEKLNGILNKLITYSENKEVFNLIKAIALLSDRYKYSEFLRFAYTISPELTDKSTIKPKIFSIPDDIFRREILDFLDNLPHTFALEFLIKKRDILINFSLIQNKFKPVLKEILIKLLKSEEPSLILKIRDNLISLIDGSEIMNYKVVLRNFLDLLIENEEHIFNADEKIFLFEHLILFYYPTKEDLKKYYEYWKNSGLKVIFGYELEKNEL